MTSKDLGTSTVVTNETTDYLVPERKVMFSEIANGAGMSGTVLSRR
jgi:hypothetical protein